MENSAWYDYFLESLYSRHSKKSRLIEELMDLLSLEREAVYRRLRKDVLFTSNEIAKIAGAWNISLDAITKVNAGIVTFSMKAINYLNPSEEELVEIQKRVRRLEHLRKTSDSEYMAVCNRLPRSLTTGFPFLYRFDIFRWNYQYGNEEVMPAFKDTAISQQLFQEMADYATLIKYTSNTSYIWDSRIVEHVVQEILYFHSILLITDEEKESLKNELIEFLDYMSDVASRGYFPETKQKVNIYISKMSIGTNYSYHYTEKLKICRIHAFDKHDIFSFDTKMVEDFRTWMQLKKRTSVQISEVDEKSRIDFFMKQRDLVNGM